MASPPSQRYLNSVPHRSPISRNHIANANYRTTNYQGDKKLAPSYFRNGNHHHITVPVPRNSVTRITVPLVNAPPLPTLKHQSRSHSPTTWTSDTLSRNSQNPMTSVAQTFPYHTVLHSPAKKHNLIIHVGLGQHPVVSSKLPYASHSYSNNHLGTSVHELPIIINSNNKAVSGKNDVYFQKWHSSGLPSTIMPPMQINKPVEMVHRAQSKAYKDWRDSLGTSTFQRKSSRNHSLKQHLNARNPPRNSYHQSKKANSNRLPNAVTTSLITPTRTFSARKKTTVHIYLRHPQKNFLNSTVGTMPPSKSLQLPSNCIRCPSNQIVVIEKGKSCATVTIPPIKLCSWLSKRPGKLEMELGVGPRPGKSVKEGKYMMQFHLFKGGAKVKTCQFRIDVKALRCPPINSPINGATRCTNETLWGSTCSFSCNFGYTLMGNQVTTCDGNKNAVSWTTLPPHCEVAALQCPPINSPINGAVHCTNETLRGSICSFSCNFGYILVGNQVTTCSGNKNSVSWTTTPPFCEERIIAALSQPGCKVPASPVNGGLYCESEPKNGIFSAGSTCHFICDKGFTIPSHLTQYGYIICISSEWNITQSVECHSVQCQRPDEPEHGFSSCMHAEDEERGDTVRTEFLNGTTCQYKCDRGYVIPTSQLSTANIKCHAPYWDNTILPECLKKTPPFHHPDDCKNVTFTEMDALGNISFLTPRFFSANGLPLKPNCSLNGSLIIPGIYENNCEATDPELRTSASCSYNIIIKVSGCTALPEVENGVIRCTSEKSDFYSISTECFYDCSDGYVIPTSMKFIQGRICLPSSEWNVTVIPECKRRLVPHPLGNACTDVEIGNNSSEISKPVFLTADGNAAEVTCTVLNVSHDGIYENTCQAIDPELQTTATCRYKIIVKNIKDVNTTDRLGGHRCGTLKAPANGKIRCSAEGSKFVCSIQCLEGYSLPTSFSKLHSNVVQCDQNDGKWNFQHNGETDLPDCLGQLPSTTLQRSLKFRVGITSCSDYIMLNGMMEAIENSLQSRIKEICSNADCSDLTNNCGNDTKRNEQMIETMLTVKVTYNVSQHEDNEEISEAELLINKIQAFVEIIISNDEDFKKEIDSAGGDLWQDSFTFDRFTLACPEPGYIVDPDTYKCFQCPKGTIEEDGSCKPCPGNYYQDVPGRIYCTPCPRGTISREGSQSKTDCKALERELTFPEPNREQALTESTTFTSCDGHPCRNGGTCNIVLNSFTCICKNGYTGKQCETIVCPENYCLNGGKCTSFVNDAVGCMCPPIFSGPRCENYIDPCSSSPCKNNGTCMPEDDSYSCHCDIYHMGEHCEFELCNRRFSYWYCQNGGICHNISGHPTCLCQENFTGLRCQYETGLSLSQEV